MADATSPGGRRGLYAAEMSGGTTAWAASADGQQIRYEIFGKGEPALVFIHGGLCDRTFWARQIGAFAARQTVVALDLPGHGESDKFRTNWSIEAFGDDVARAVRAAGVQRAVLVGHSLGALVALAAARLLGTSVTGIVAVDFLHAPSAKAPPRPPMDRETLRVGMKKGMFMPAADELDADRILDHMLSSPAGVALGTRGAAERYDAATSLRAVADVPLSIVLSGLRPVDSADVRTLHPGARITVLPDAGHFLMLEQPAAFNDVLAVEMRIMSGEVAPV